MNEKDINDNTRLTMVQDIVRMAIAHESDAKISAKMNIPIMHVVAIRNFWGIRYRKGIDIQEDYKKLLSNLQFVFGGTRLLKDLNIDVLTSSVSFKVISLDKKNKTFTIKVVAE